jgi:hypothetical protein
MEKPQRQLGTVAEPSMPTLIFTHWREALNQAALSAAARGGYSLAIGSYLDYCRRNGLSVTLDSKRLDIKHFWLLQCFSMSKAKGSKPRRPVPVPPGFETALLSGRFGDWVYYVRNGRQFRRRYVVPTDRRSPGQLRTRANFAGAVKYWSHTAELTEQDRAAWETTANQIQSRPRLQQSGPLTGQQYFVGQACKGKPRLGPTSARQARQRQTSARQVADCGMERTAPRAKTRPQVAQVQCVAPSTPESPRHIALSKGERRPALAGTTRPCRQGCPSTAGLRKGIGGQHRFTVRRRSDARRVHPACSYGAATVSPRCGLCKGVRNSYLHRSGGWVALWSGMPEAEERGQCRPAPGQSAKRKRRSSRVRLWENLASPSTSSARAFFCFCKARILPSMLFLMSRR